MRKRTFLFVSQVFVPDPAAVGQYIHSAAAELVKRGHRVIVLTSSRGYEEPTLSFPARQVVDGIEVRRLPFSSFGKRSFAMRLLGSTAFLLQACFHSLWLPKLDAVMVSTSPPFAPAAGALLSWVKRCPLKLWLMDLNPDQLVALKHVREGSVVARVFDALNRIALRRAQDVIVLDRYMAQRTLRKTDVTSKLTVLPPWPLSEDSGGVPHADNPFCIEHGLTDKFVFAYSGNHSPSNPIATILAAAGRLGDRDDVAFLFIGAGSGKRDVELAARDHRHIRSLPYQPLASLRYSLSAADVHIVIMGDDVAGIIHPCKVYGAMGVERPILFVGPRESHVGELIENDAIGWRIAHGDVDGAEALLRQIVALGPTEIERIGRRAGAVLRQRFDRRELCSRFCDVIEAGLAAQPVRMAHPSILPRSVQ